MLRKISIKIHLAAFFFFSIFNLIASDTDEISGSGDIFEKLGAVIDGHDIFQDSENKTVTLTELSHNKDVIVFSLNYFQCKDICSFQFKDMKEKIATLDSELLAKVLFLSISFDSRDKFKEAKAKEEIFNKEKKLPWKFLVGPESSIQKLSKSVNFFYKYEKEQDVFAHGAGLFFLSSPGLKFKRYLYGIINKPEDIRKAIYDTSSSSIGPIFDRMKLFIQKTFQAEYGRYKNRF